MSTAPSAGSYQRAAELAEAGRYQDALALIEQYLDGAPDDAQAWNDAAVLLHCLGRSDLAIDYLERARRLTNDPRVTWNLVEALLAEADVARAMELFGDLEKVGILSTDALNRAACLYLADGKLQQAIGLLEWSCRIDPTQCKVLAGMIEKIKAKAQQDDKQ